MRSGNATLGRILFSSLALVAFVTLVDSPAVAACRSNGASCTHDSHCCPGYLCGSGSRCQKGCRINRAFVRSGTTNPTNVCQSCQPNRSNSSWSDVSNGTSCDDGDSCTAFDSCTAGACAGGTPAGCDDGNPCTTDSCDPALGCEHVTRPCADEDPCTEDSCDPETGECLSTPSQGACEDGNLCTTDDSCATGTCVGGPPRDCDDGNPCTVDSCDPVSGCVNDGGPVLDPATPGAFLVYPYVVVSSASEGGRIETLVTLTNTSDRPVRAHAALINGDPQDRRYCYECNYDFLLDGFGTARLLLTRAGTTTKIKNIDTGASRSCAQRVGFLTIDVEDSSRRVLTDNVLVGSAVVVNYSAGTSFSIPAISIQGGTGDGNRKFRFDNDEYRSFPSFIQGDFVAPDLRGPAAAQLVLFTLGFRRQHPPVTECEVIGSDSQGGRQFSTSLTFGCFTSVRLQDLDPAFAAPNLGSDEGHLRLSCKVEGTDENALVFGGVHGVLVQTEAGGDATGNLLGQSPWGGCPMTLRLAEPIRAPQF